MCLIVMHLLTPWQMKDKLPDSIALCSAFQDSLPWGWFELMWIIKSSSLVQIIKFRREHLTLFLWSWNFIHKHWISLKQSLLWFIRSNNDSTVRLLFDSCNAFCLSDIAVVKQCVNNRNVAILYDFIACFGTATPLVFILQLLGTSSHRRQK